MEYFPCSCSICNKREPESMRKLPKEERQKLLAEHNLYVSFCELRQIKQAIIDGRLWEHMEMRAHGHPSLLQALKKITKYSKWIEKQSPIIKKRGIFFFSSLGLARPEVVRYKQRLFERYTPPQKTKILVLLPQIRKKPYHSSREHERLMMKLQQTISGKIDLIHFCTYAVPFGVVPKELDDVYPISQNMITSTFDTETIEYVAKQVANYITKIKYMLVILLCDPDVWKGKVLTSCKRICKKNQISFIALQNRKPWEKTTLEQLATVIYNAIITH
jgi:7-cyano-7-deazaguanine tRNA-ribosyltransferase